MRQISTAYPAPCPQHSGRRRELRDFPATDQAIRLTASRGGGN